MDFKSIGDLLHFAVSKEQASRQFYLELTSQMQDPATQKIFQAIAQQEERHEEALKLEILKQGYTLPAEDVNSDQPSEYEWEEHLELDQEAMNMNYTEALMLAIQKERAAFQLYTQLIAMTQDMEFRKVLLDLAEEEMRHVIQFEREYDAVSH